MSGAGLQGRVILVVEDEFLIAAMLIDALEEAGARTIGPFASVASAIDALGKTPIDAAVLDWNLNGERSTPVGASLAEAGIPFVVSTGYVGVESDVGDVPILAKPYPPDVLVDTLVRMLQQ